MRQLLATIFLISLASQVQASPAEKIAFAYCPMKHVIGHGTDANLLIAEDKAKNDCVVRGGVPGCCFKFFGEDTAQERARVIHSGDAFVSKQQ